MARDGNSKSAFGALERLCRKFVDTGKAELYELFKELQPEGASGGE